MSTACRCCCCRATCLFRARRTRYCSSWKTAVDGSVSVNDAFKPLSRYFDRIIYPEQLLTALPRAIAALTDPAACGPVTLSLPQDVQTMAYDYPEEFFAPRDGAFPRDAAGAVRAGRGGRVVARTQSSR